LISNCK